MSRWFGFIIAVLLGLAAGLYYGWAIDPVEFVNTSPDMLLIDYKTDYVLMVSEAYQLENDLNLAAQRIAVLDKIAPVEIVQQALIFAARAGYVDADLERMRTLETLLEGWNPGGESNLPPEAQDLQEQQNP
jgi:hypothetical protein